MEENSYSKGQIEKLVRSVRDTEKLVEEGYAAIAAEGNIQQNEVPVVVFLGPTGSGKTTLYYALCDKKLEGYRDGARRRIKATNSEDNFKIGHTGKAETTIPGLKYNSDTNIIYCDCPGFFDNRTEIQDITNSFAINHVLSQAKNVKILLLASYTDIESAKAKTLIESCEIIEKLIPDQDQLRSSIGLVITACNPEDCEDNVSFLQNVDCGKGWLMYHFKNNEKTGNLVFNFPYPKRENFNEPLKDFKDREKILSFIRQNNVEKITPFVSLSNKAKLMLLGGIDSFGDLSIIIRLFVDRIRIDLSESDDKLEMWKDRVERLNKCTFSTPLDFVNQAKEIINPSSNLYDDAYKQILKINDWRSFLEKIVSDDPKYKDEIINRQSQMLNPVFLDITKYFDELLSPVMTIINTRLAKYEVEKKRDQLVEELKIKHEENLKLEKEKSDERIKAMQREEEMKRQLASLNDQKLQFQREAEDAHRQLAMAMNQGGGGDGGFFSSFVGGALGGYLFSLI